MYVAVPLAALGALLVWWFPSVAIADNQIDLWINFGLFFNYPSELHWLVDNRQVSRLPVVLPGFVLTNLFGIITASYILFFGYYLTTLSFFYYAANRLISRDVAIVSTIFLATSAYIVGNFSITLAAAPAAVYNTVALYLVARAITTESQARANVAMFVSGIAVGLAINCHLVIVAYAGANYLIYIVAELARTNDSILRRGSRIIVGGLLAFCGAALVTAILGAIIVIAFHGSFLQILNDWAYVPVTAKTNPLYFHPDWYRYGAEGGMLLAACLIALINIAALRRRASRVDDGGISTRLFAVSVAILVLSAVLLAYNQTGGPFLQYSSYFLCFVPFLALVIFSPLATCGLRYASLMPVAVAFSLSSVIIVLLGEKLAPRLYSVPEQATASAECGLCLAALYGLLLVRSPDVAKKAIATVYVLGVLAMSFIARPDEKVGSHMWIDSRQQQTLQRGLYVRLGEGLSFLTGLGFKTEPKFWVDLRNPKFGVDVGTSDEPAIFARTYLEYRYQPFPNIDRSLWDSLDFCRFAPGDDVIVISDAPNLRTVAEKAFSDIHLTVAETAHTVVAYEGTTYQILVEHVTGKI